MASEVQICNLALSHLGDTATVASINPPEGSAQAEHCARFYPIARDMVLERHIWNFNTRRASLSYLTPESSQWAYAYAVPNLMKKAIAVLAPDADDDYLVPRLPTDGDQLYRLASYAPQDFVVEVLSTGAKAILTNQEDAVLRYTVSVTDSAMLPAHVVAAISWLLASMLAGPVVKGDAGAAEGKRCLSMYEMTLSQAINYDADQRTLTRKHAFPWGR